MGNKITRNEGIVAKNVSANAIAVGAHSQATANNGMVDVEQFRSSVAELERVIERAKIPENAKAAILVHVNDLNEEAKKPAPDGRRVEGTLKSLLSSVKLLGEFVSNAKIILSPILAIAAIFGFAIS